MVAALTQIAPPAPPILPPGLPSSSAEGGSCTGHFSSKPRPALPLQTSCPLLSAFAFDLCLFSFSINFFSFFPPELWVRAVESYDLWTGFNYSPPVACVGGSVGVPRITPNTLWLCLCVSACVYGCVSVLCLCVCVCFSVLCISICVCLCVADVYLSV